MYHDEFANRPTNPNAKWNDLLLDLAMQIGGGLSLALMASLNRSASIVLFTIGGRLPIVAWCLSTTTAQVLGSFMGIAPKVGSDLPSALPTPHFPSKSRTLAAGPRRWSKVGASR